MFSKSGWLTLYISFPPMEKFSQSPFSSDVQYHINEKSDVELVESTNIQQCSDLHNDKHDGAAPVLE